MKKLANQRVQKTPTTRKQTHVSGGFFIEDTTR